MTATAYLAGPDVFLPNAVAHAATKVEICRRLGLRGLPPLNEDAETAATELEVWQAIYEKTRDDGEKRRHHCQPHAVRRRIRRCRHVDRGRLVSRKRQADLRLFEHAR